MTTEPQPPAFLADLAELADLYANDAAYEHRCAETELARALACDARPADHVAAGAAIARAADHRARARELAARSESFRTAYLLAATPAPRQYAPDPTEDDYYGPELEVSELVENNCNGDAPAGPTLAELITTLEHYAGAEDDDRADPAGRAYAHAARLAHTVVMGPNIPQPNPRPHRLVARLASRLAVEAVQARNHNRGPAADAYAYAAELARIVRDELALELER